MFGMSTWRLSRIDIHRIYPCAKPRCQYSVQSFGACDAGFWLDTQKCTSITVDGASVMTGSLGEVRGLMQNVTVVLIRLRPPRFGLK